LALLGKADSPAGMTDRKAEARTGLTFVVSHPSRVREGWGTRQWILVSQSMTFEGAAVVDGWFSQVDLEHHKLASWLLRDIVFDERAEMVERLVDALNWFGDAASELSPGAKIAKFVMLLERLTATTKRFSKKRFCRYVAILCFE
jgi:hypothetical protein